MSLDVEKAVLASMALDLVAFEKTSRITDEFFVDQDHRYLFVIMNDMFSNGLVIDPLTVQERCRKDGRLVDFQSVFSYVPSASNVGHYVEIMIDRFMRSAYSRLGSQLALSADGEDLAELAEKFEKDFYAIRNQKDNSRSLGQIMRRAMDEYEKKLSLISTGLGLDYYRIAKPGRLVVVAGRPSMGKTALGVNMFTYATMEKRVPSKYFSLEMTAEELMTRIFASVLSIDSSLMENDKLDAGQWEKIHLLAAKIESQMIPMWIDDRAGLSALDVRGAVQRHLSAGLKLVFVDYLQMMSSHADNEGNRNMEIERICQALKDMAKEHKLCVYLFCQLNRQVETRANKRPVLSDLRDSGSIEQIADSVVFIYREEYYKNVEPSGELIVAKNRQGPTGTVKVFYEPEFTRFVDRT